MNQHWFLKVNTPNFEPKLSFGDKAFFIGSCFSKEMSALGKSQGMSFMESPLGTVFHPEVLANQLQMINEEGFNDSDFFEENDTWYCWLASHDYFARTKERLQTLLEADLSKARKWLRESKYLFITLGSAFAYVLNDQQKMVANCHKQNQNLFEKRLSSTEDLFTCYKNLLSQIQKSFPELQVVITVSPVRHKRDGLIENNRSKARLHLLAEFLEIEGLANYFPAYEIVIDALRDYRFFEDDLVHPNKLAVSEVWASFESAFLVASEAAVRKKVRGAKQMLDHRATNNVLKMENFKRQKEQIALFNPKIDWT